MVLCSLFVNHKKKGARFSSSYKKMVVDANMRLVQMENYSEWYSQMIEASELIDFHDVSSCYILRPLCFL